MIETAEKAHRVLVADAEMASSSVVRKTLEDHGHNVTVCRDGNEAWHNIQSGGWDLLLLELDLPGIDGFRILSRCSHNADLEDLPVLAISGSDDDADYDRALALGAWSCLTKPLRMPLLTHAVWQVFRSRSRDLELRRMRQQSDPQVRAG